MKVPFLDLHRQYLSIAADIDAAIRSVIAESAYIGGKHVKSFEDSFAGYLEADHCIGVGNGTDALEIALAALELPDDAEVIVPANSFIATSEAVTRAGYRVVFCDALPGSHTLDLADAERRVTEKTLAIIPVHLYGRPCDMDGVMALARRHGLSVIEDCAQAHGALYRGRRVGTFGDFGCFSFYPGKNLGAYGDAGAIVTNDEELATASRMIANHGRIAKYDHRFEGRNSRLDGMQAAILSVKLTHLEKWTELRRANAETYRTLLAGADILLPQEEPEARHVYHLFVIESGRREALKEGLHREGIETGIHYPIPLPLLQAYADRFDSAGYPAASAAAGRILSLPMSAELTQEQVCHVASTLLRLQGGA
ncbi:DegT/DnrJ/EryC1/StrS family aminotransferase [Geomonas sp. RF6]|uniref:DegT/DnrJ/EryC1/StrS family aminotransferase n=1 Tax=Geomonas sp. RF6 TaxID=2897342 RepID=UPI001E624E73|nr:DegT/DnrJ/EryC1/StrS family aminotransferase [Geomonas sp. RF6]UFS72431.1 DegT/DnrJ/EryC1/StrS family aminotransferase [Geomonas sp. RF6]